MGTNKTGKAQPAAPTGLVGSHADYEKYLPDAMALDAGEVIPYRADVSLAAANIDVGLAALLEREAAAKTLAGINLAQLKQLPNKCMAVAFALTQISDASAVSTTAKLVRASELRKKLFRAADALVDDGVFPAGPVKQLHAGTGKIDMASDCVGLAALFQKHAAKAKGKSTVTAADVAEAAKIGTELLKVLRPSNAKKTRSEEARKAADVRDRLWTLVKRGYDDLWRACAFLYGPDQIEEKVPALLAHAATSSNRKKANAKKKAEKAGAAAQAKAGTAANGAVPPGG